MGTSTDDIDNNDASVIYKRNGSCASIDFPPYKRIGSKSNKHDDFVIL